MTRGLERDWKLRAAAFVVFLLGFLAGALALNLYRGSQAAAPEANREARFSKLLDQLQLTDDQRGKVEGIFKETRSQMAEVRKECGPKFKEVRDRTDAKLREVLTPEQWERFERLTREARERHGHRRDDDSH